MPPHYIVARCLLYDYLRNIYTDRLGNDYPSQLSQSSNHPTIQSSVQPTNHPFVYLFVYLAVYFL